MRSKLARKLIRWFEANARDLPWRRRRTPYRVWLSEMMLQQTQVDTVIPYFRRFTKRFPTVGALADAPLDEVLKLWEGLGYYARARNLHRAARIVAHEFKGRFPKTVEGLMRLPGVGRYSAGAIASLAFGVDAPALDGNVARVLCRIFAIRRDPREARTRDELWSLAGSLLPKGQAGKFNEALMELGATICTPRAPKCEICPIAAHCEARRRGIQERLPVRHARKLTPHYDVTAAVIRHNGRVLIAQRPHEGMLGGLWEFPGGKREAGESHEAALARELTEELSATFSVREKVETVRWEYPDRVVILHFYRCRHEAGTIEPREGQAMAWVAADRLGEFEFPPADRELIRRLRAAPGHPG